MVLLVKQVHLQNEVGAVWAPVEGREWSAKVSASKGSVWGGGGGLITGCGDQRQEGQKAKGSEKEEEGMCKHGSVI